MRDKGGAEGSVDVNEAIGHLLKGQAREGAGEGWVGEGR